MGKSQGLIFLIDYCKVIYNYLNIILEISVTSNTLFVFMEFLHLKIVIILTD